MALLVAATVATTAATSHITSEKYFSAALNISKYSALAYWKYKLWKQT